LGHSLTYALIEIDDPAATALSLGSTNPRTRRAALIALDQMSGGGLSPAAVAPGLTPDDPAPPRGSARIARPHPDWADHLAGFFAEQIGSKTLSVSDRAGLAEQLARFARAGSVQRLLARPLRDDKAPPASRLLALQAMARSGLKEVPTLWSQG